MAEKSSSAASGAHSHASEKINPTIAVTGVPSHWTSGPWKSSNR